jgi:hypothetical protein
MAAFQWPVSKLETVNSALSQCGDNLIAVADDGSEEWNVASPAYERALAYMIESHGWSQATAVRVLQPSNVAPTDKQYDTAYSLPDDLVHLIFVRLAGAPCNWDLLNDQLVVNAQGGPPPPSPPATAAEVSIKGVFSTNSDPTFGTPTFVLALVAFVMSGIYRGLHKDVGQAERMWNAGKAMLMEAKSRHDMQKPKRAIFNSRMTAVRRRRKPFPQTPSGWSGTGNPS